MRSSLIICVLFLASCSYKHILPRVEEIPASYDILINYYWDSEDSLEIYIPYSFKIHNDSNKKILFHEVSVWDTIRDQDFKSFDEEGNSLRYLNDISINYISPKSSKVVIVYTKVVESKNNIPAKYWKDISKEEMLQNKNQLPTTDIGVVDISNWKKRRENDTISFRFSNRDQNDLFIYYSLKTKKTKVDTAKEIAESYLEKHK